MTAPLKVLIAEDSPDDAELVMRELHRAGFQPDWQRVETESEFSAALHPAPDLIISDYAMPAFSGLRALELVQASHQDIPFILISGTIGEDIAVEAMRHGASDYVLKDRIARLGAAVTRAIEQKSLRQMHRRLREENAARERRLNAFFTGASAGLVLLDRELRFVQINDTLADINGRPAKDHLGRTLGEILPHLAPTLEPLLHRVLATAQPQLDIPIHGETARAPGIERHWVQSFFPILGPAGEVEAIGGIIVETTERQRALQALQESEENFRQITQNIYEVFWITDTTKGRIIYVSPAYATIWGRSCESLYASPQAWIEAIHPEDRTRITAAATTKQTLGTYNETYRILRPDGSIRWIHDRAFPLLNEHGEVYRIAGSAEDITENRILEEQFRQSQKMEAVGMLSSGIAHDFNNILGIILMQVGLMREEDDPAQFNEHAQEIERAAQRAADLTRQLLLFSRRQVAQPRDLNLNELTANLSKMLHRTLSEDIQLQLNYAPNPLIVHADPGMLDQVLLNLTVNARDAMPHGGRLIIDVSAITFDTLSATQSPRARPGAFACLAVTDTGCGIAPDVKPRIFDPFFTTKEVGKGTGLGLATVFGIIQQHQGWIDVHSDLGLGTSFRIYLPLSPTTNLAPRPQTSTTSIPGGHETILVVEDEPQLRALIRATLTRLGYQVIEAENGAKALDPWRKRQSEIQLLITDMVMPGGISGKELSTRLLADRPDLKIIYTSGYSPELFAKDFEIREGDNFLTKPFQVQSLAETVRRRLDAR